MQNKQHFSNRLRMGYRDLTVVVVALFLFLSLSGQDTLYVDLNSALNILYSGNYQRINTNSEDKGDKLSISDINLPATKIDYSYGKLYTPEIGWKVDVNQDFGNVFSYKREKDVNNAKQILRNRQEELKKKRFELKMKSIYFEWIYLYNLRDNIELIRKYISKSISVAEIKDELGENEPIEYMKMITRVSEIETQYMENRIDIDIARNNLRKLLNTNAFLIPMSRKLELYMVKKKDDTSAYSGGYITDIYKEKYNYTCADLRLRKAYYSPTVNAGFFIQNIDPYNTMTGVQAGISVPIWFFPVKSQVKKAKLQSEMELNMYKQAVNETETEIENLLFKLDRCFLRVRHFQNNAIPMANLQLNTVISKYRHEAIDYEEYIEGVTEALNIKQKYLEAMNEYNQTAIRLELYTK